LTRGKQRAQRIQCIGNLKNIGTAFQIFAHDHHGKFPMQVPTAEGGAAELVEAGNSINGVFYFSYKHLQTLANELVVPRILVCPADLGREPAPAFGSLQNSNVSYFVGVYADYNVPESILAGDRNITNDLHATASLVRGTYGLRWTSELHAFKGNVLFADAHVEEVNNPHVELPAAAVNSVFFLPAVRSPATLAATPASIGTISGPAAAPADLPPSAPHAGLPGNARPGAPPQPPPATASARSLSSSRRTANESTAAPTIIETTARETNGVPVTNGTEPAAAPATDDNEPPLLWLLGAARALVTKASWWLLLLLAVLIGIALYLYSRRKTRERRP
jgi:prepilin-type processing-associated H-X9-DG protein